MAISGLVSRPRLPTMDRRDPGLEAHDIVESYGDQEALAAADTPMHDPSRSAKATPPEATLARRYTLGMTTTIKVSDKLRDRLKEQAARDGLTLGAHLAYLADAEDRRWRLDLLKSAIDASSSTEAGSHAAETGDWERTELADAR